jgi:TonB-dependent SusC/RagA subfamily outer membrane receptor
MPLFPLYLIKLTISLSIVWLFYQLLLRRLTFYNLNRWYLLGYSILAFLIPLIRIGPIVENGPAFQPRIIQFIPAIGSFMPPAGKGGAAGASVTYWYSALDGWSSWLLILVLGAAVMLMRAIGRWLSLRRVRQQARLIETTGIKIYQVDANITPFSFGNAIYINQHLHTEKEWEAIVLHEYVHIRQQHTVDILLAELICILNWYNPFAWMIRHSIRQNLEFIADHKVLENGIDKKNYQYHLLKVIGEPRYRLANNFNFSSLKKRIIMMNKIRSTRLHLLKFLFILPVVTLLLVAFRDKYDGVEKEFHTDSVPSPPFSLSAPSMQAALVHPAQAAPVHASSVQAAPVHASASQAALVHASAVPSASLATSSVPDTLPSNILYVLDGTPMPRDWSFKKISPSMIYSMSVLKDEKAMAAFGERGISGVICITTKTFYKRFTRLHLLDAEHPLQTPLYFVDGEEISKAKMDLLDPNEIRSIDVLKGEAAIGNYGERGRNGAVLITTKKKKVIPG